MLGLFLRTRLAMDNYLHQWDERFHALVSKNMMDHPLKPALYETPVLKYDYKEWYANHIWLHKQPLPLWLISASYAAFGISEFTTRLPSLLFSLLAIYITFLLGRHFFSERTGLLAAFFMTINGLVLEIGSGRIATDHYDLLFMAFIEISVLFAWRSSVSKKTWHTLICGVFMGLAVITKWLPCLVILIIHYCLLKNTNTARKELLKQLGLSFLTCLMIAAPWQIYILTMYPLEAKWEYFHHWLHVTEELDGRTGNGYLYFIDKIRMNYSEIVYMPLLFFAWRLYQTKFKDYRLLALFIWLFIPILFFSFVSTKMQGYILFICPALFILTAEFFFELKAQLVNWKERKVLLVFSWMVLIAILVLPIRYCYERTSFGLVTPPGGEYISQYKQVQPFPKHAVILNVKHPVDFMFYNGGTAYAMEEISAEEKEMVLGQGYQIFKYDPVTNRVNKTK